MNFEGDAFISYAHLDNLELIRGQKGWVTNLHRALEIRVAQLLGKQPHIWRDPKLKGNDQLAGTLIEKLARVAVLIPVVSPRYIKSDWAMKELAAFADAAERQGGLQFEDKLRIFKVLKTPVPLDQHPAELQPVLGYEFFRTDPETGRTRELNEVFGPEAQREFWLKLDDLAHDICDLLERLGHADSLLDAEPEDLGVYLAETTSDLREQRETLRRDLQQHGYAVYPTQPLPCVEGELEAAVRRDLEKCRMSVLMVGRNLSTIPEGCRNSLLEVQNQLTMERAREGNFSRILWIPSGQRIEDERQLQFVNRLRLDPQMVQGADLLETWFEDLRSLVQEKLKRPTQPAEAPAVKDPARQVQNGAKHKSLYVIHDQRDSDAVAEWISYLFGRFEVLRSIFEGDEAEIREYHEENLRESDGVLIFYGSTNECWVRRNLRQIQKAPGYGRTKAAPAVGILVTPPRNAEKERFLTHEATVLPQLDGLSPDALQPFIASLKG
jgi:hypothetical protein